MLRNFILQLVVSKIRKKFGKKKLPSKIGFWEHFWGLVGVGFLPPGVVVRLVEYGRSTRHGIAMGGGVWLFSGSGECFQKSTMNFLSLTFGLVEPK